MVHRRLLKGFQIMNEIEPGTCPNFYLWGESVSKLEADANELTAMMEMDKVMQFQGAVRVFQFLCRTMKVQAKPNSLCIICGTVTVLHGTAMTGIRGF